jgi:hypothetical protein
MSESLAELEARRRMLVLRSERLRADLGHTYGDFETRLSGIDRVVSMVRGFASPSVLLSVGGLGLGLLRHVRPFKWATRGLLIFSLARRILGAIRTSRAGSAASRR